MGAPGWYYVFATVFGGTGALVGLVGGVLGVWAFFRSRAADARSKTTEDAVAEERKKRRAEHAEMVAVQREMAKALTALTTSGAASPAWVVEPATMGIFQLRNTGTAPAVTLEIDCESLIVMGDGVADFILPHQTVDLVINTDWRVQRSDLLYVRWANQPEWVAVPIPWGA